jgi:hypothetical protein
MYFGDDQGDAPGLDTDRSPAADPVSDDNAVGLTRVGSVIDGGLELLLQYVRPFVQAGFQEFEVDGQTQPVGSVLHIHPQHCTTDEYDFWGYLIIVSHAFTYHLQNS